MTSRQLAITAGNHSLQDNRPWSPIVHPMIDSLKVTSKFYNIGNPKKLILWGEEDKKMFESYVSKLVLGLVTSGQRSFALERQLWYNDSAELWRMLSVLISIIYFFSFFY